MPGALLALIAACAALAATPAVARDYPYCIKGCNYGAGLGDCSFTSYEQCQATAAGLVATCAANPNFSAKAEMASDRGRQSRRRF
jgi:hypothetical protein